MESFVLHDIELSMIKVCSPQNRSLSTVDENLCFDQLDTKLGQMHIYRQGCEFNKRRPILMTYHDIGLNSVSNFQAFFNYSDMKLLLQSISVIHLNAIGQEDNAPNYPPSVPYPTLDELAEQISEVCERYKIKNFIGFGVGAGANILSRFALKHPKMVDGLILINPTASKASWTEWAYQKMNVYYLSSGLPEKTREYLMWHHFGYLDETKNYDLVESFKNYFAGKTINAYNLALFINSFIKRTDLDISREVLDKNFKCPILLACGALSPHLQDSVDMNSRIDPANSTWLKLADCGMVLEEQPGKLAEALKLFIQGLGYALTSYDKKKNLAKINSLDTDYYQSVLDHHGMLDEKNLSSNSHNLNMNDKPMSGDRIEYGPRKDGHNFIIENPIEHC